MAGIDLEQALKAAQAAADAARREILPRFRRTTVETKADGSPVTEADRAAERAMREALSAAGGDLPMLGEEYGGDAAAAERGWIIDPIDGTLSFSRGLPLFGTLVALREGGRSVLGLIDLPALGERCFGYAGGGAWRVGADAARPAPLRVADESDLARTLVAHGDALAFERFGQGEGYRKLAAELPMFRGYSDAFGHAMVLCGRVGAMVDVDLKLWDIAATEALVPEAGGRLLLREQAGARRFGMIFGSAALVEQLRERLGW